MLNAYQDESRPSEWLPRRAPSEGTIKMVGSRSRDGLRALVLAVVLAVVALLSVQAASASGLPEVGSRAPVAVPRVARAPSYGVADKSPTRVQYSSPRVNGLRFRTKSNFRGYVRGQLYRGDRVQVLGWSGHWMHVRLTKRSHGGLRAGSAGWVWKGYLYGPECRSYKSWPCTAWR
ncbi:SH3 domain-containing protein [Actinacidiphila sp. DG2A-62]|uniref:SH3 domain-containing protein n=1 Tax=Actinacidiphila sp. DG2A-62 TaxID=3108821 RepID=UPI002DBB6871|nr:SH3 domain-containing protein [Actinacidiphila sp. DG2A-62]MEC3996764.1 SH3 domain-containing protein [Actinacidiphila sp. DG2A-62]